MNNNPLGISTQTEGSQYEGQYSPNSKNNSKKLGRRNTTIKKENEKLEKREKILARAKSLSDLNRKFHGYSPTGYESEIIDSASSVSATWSTTYNILSVGGVIIRH